MKKQSTMGLFFSMFLRAIVVILGIIILIFGIVFLMKVLKKDGGTSKSPATTVGENVLTEQEVADELLTAEPTEEATTEATGTDATAVDAVSADKNILVLNSTDTSGVAGRWCAKLNEYGYANTAASDYATPETSTRVISTTDGVGQDLVQYFKGATYEIGTVTEGSSVSTDGYDIVIIIGSDDILQ